MQGAQDPEMQAVAPASKGMYLPNPMELLVNTLLQTLAAVLKQLEEHSRMLEELSHKWEATRNGKANPFESVKQEVARLMAQVDEYIRSGKLAELSSEVGKVVQQAAMIARTILELLTRYGGMSRPH